MAVQAQIMIGKPSHFFIIALALFLSACSVDVGDSNAGTATPLFATATLPATSTPAPTRTPLPPTPVPTTVPIEGLTTTQINVRAQPSTTSAVLGLILPSIKVQVIGKDASGTWYQVLFPESAPGKGWIIAAYVQVTAGVDVPVVQMGAGPGSGASVLVIERVNVRSGPGTHFESLGTLSPQDVAALTGRDSSGEWLQVEFPSAPDGRGWITTKFVQPSGVENLPVVADASPSQAAGTGTPTEVLPTPTRTLVPAMDDGDSASAPSSVVNFSPAGVRALQISGTVSAPQGDAEDWVQFTPYGAELKFHVSCSGSDNLLIEIWREEVITDQALVCGELRTFEMQPDEAYLIHLMATDENGPAFIEYTLKIEQLP